MRVVWHMCVATFGFLATFSASAAESSATSAAAAVNGCSSVFDAGTGDDVKKAVRLLHVDLDHGVSVMMLPGFAAAAYSVSLVKASNGEWSLTYAIDSSLSNGRSYRAAVPFFSTDDAQRIEKVWATAIAEAKPRSSASSNELSCIHLDGWSYVFSANGRQANNFAGEGVIPHQMAEISNTLRLIAMDTKNTGHPVVSSLDDLSDQLNRIEGELKISSQH